MYKNLLKQWIENISQEDFERYLKLNNLTTSKEESEILFHLLKSDWEGIYEGKEETFLKVKSKVSKETYEKLYNLYLKVKNKYKI